MIINAVLRRKELRTARNIFIFNLALSDLLLSISIPFTLLDVLNKQFPFYQWPIVCKYETGEPSQKKRITEFATLATLISRHASKYIRDHGVYSLICTFPNLLNLRVCNATASFAHTLNFEVHLRDIYPRNIDFETFLQKNSEITEVARIYSLICTYP